MSQPQQQPETIARRFKGLSGGWVVSKRGLGIRTGFEAQSPAYLAVFWTDDSLDKQSVSRWNDEKTRFARERAVLGQKGAYAKLAALSGELDRQFEELIGANLRESRGSLLDEPRMEEIAGVIAHTADIRLVSLVVCRNHVRVLFCLEGEVGVDSLVREWCAALPGVCWSSEFHVQAVMPDECAGVSETMMAELGAELEPMASSEAEEDASAGPFHHVTVLLHETVDLLEPAEGKLIVDATLGGGGHAELMLERGATVWGIDQDPDARRAATKRLARFGNRFKVLAGNFRDVAGLLASEGVDKVDGLVADLGISSHQVDTADRGFSFREDGPLDMRMNPSSGRSATDLVNETGEQELADIIWQYGEERASRAIARAIVHARKNGRIETTGQLADIVASVLPRKGKQHPGTRTFQALRIAVNDELGALDDLLDASVNVLSKGGRFAVITFHSLEDRRVKQFFDYRSRPEIDRKEWPAPRPNPDYAFRLLHKKPIVAGEQEISNNPRSRSAKLRGVEKIN